MSDIAFFDAALGIKPQNHLQQATHRHNQVDRQGRRCTAVTAAVASGNLLAIATVETYGAGLRLRPNSAVFFELEGREQTETVRVLSNLERHLRSARIRRILLRTAPETGPYSAKGAVYRLETILQLVPGLAIDVVHTQKVGGWIRNKGIALPDAEVIGAKYVSAQRSAIQTAVFGPLGE
jgi:hypothetical protein